MGYGNSFLLNAALEDYEDRICFAHTRFVSTGSATAASRTVTSDNPGIIIKNYIGSGAQPTVTEDSQATFGTLAANAQTLGVLLVCLNADSAFEPVIQLLGNTAGTNANTTITYALVGTSSTGVTTTLKNVAVVVTMGTFDSTGANSCTGEFKITYRRLFGK